jgi:hypothetical protein
MPKQSMFGGTPIFIRSNGGLDDMPAQNNVIMESQNIPGALFPAKMVTGKFK